MTRIQKTVLWTVAVCVFGYMGAHVLIIDAPGTAAAQDTPGTEAAPEDAPQATDKAPVPEEPAATDPTDPVAPARVLTTEDRALTAICVGDKGEPLDDVIVDIFRQSVDDSPLSPPRVESFGRTKTQDGGRFSVALPLIKSAAKSDEALAMYVVYFMAPGRQIKSLIVANDTKLPTKIAIPTTSTERLYLPTHHLVLAKTKGISVSPMLSAPRFGTKEGQLARVEQFADHRNSDDKTSSAEAVTGDPAPSTVLAPAVDGAHVAYPFKTANTENDARKLAERYAGRANIHLESRPESLGVSYLHVRAPASFQAEIRAVVGFLTGQQSEPTDAGGGAGDSGGSMMSMAAPRQATQYGYLGLAQRQQQAAQERVQAARQRLTEAKTDEDKNAARAQLKQLLSEIFTQDMQAREKQAAEIESRLAILRKQYQERKAAKDKIIDLQTQVIEADAAGLGFPGGHSSAATPPTPIRSNRSNLPASTTDPLIRRGQSGANVPAKGVDAHDPIPQERTLEEAKQTRPAAVKGLKKRGHFIESTDGRVFAYANIHQPSGRSHIRVVDSATGKLIGAAAVNSVVGPLELNDDGVASREADGVLQLRVPLKRRRGPEGAVIEVPSSTAQNPFDPKQAALDPEFLKQYPTDHQTRVGELSARGHFVGSQDGKLYAYVETKGDGIPEGTAEIRVCDVRTGQRLAAAKIKAPVGKLKFFNEGVATEDPDGTLKLRITLSKDHDTQDVLETVFPKTSNSSHPPSSGTVVSPASAQATVTSEYNALRDQYRKAKAPLAQAVVRFKSLVEEAQKQRPETSDEDAKKQHPAAWQAVERARPDYEAANRLLETKLDLLKLDRKAATAARYAARSILAELAELHKQGGISTSEMNKQRAALEAADFEIERASRLISLFESITSEPTPTPDSQSADKPSGSVVPALAGTHGVSVRDILAFKPETAGIDHDQPTDSEIDACRVVLEPGEAWTLLDRNLVLLRRFVDKNHDGVVDLWAYYKSGKEVYRDVDTNYDGTIDYREGVDDGKDDQSEKAEPGGLIESTTAIEVQKTEAAIKLNQAAATEKSNQAARVPSDSAAVVRMVSVRDMLAFKPEAAGIDYDQPADLEIDSCRVALEPGAAWSLLSREGVLLRRFEDTNRDGVVDSWRFYKGGKLVHRDVDNDHDGKVDRHEGPESPERR